MKHLVLKPQQRFHILTSGLVSGCDLFMSVDHAPHPGESIVIAAKQIPPISSSERGAERKILLRAVQEVPYTHEERTATQETPVNRLNFQQIRLRTARLPTERRIYAVTNNPFR